MRREREEGGHHSLGSVGGGTSTQHEPDTLRRPVHSPGQTQSGI